LLKAKIKKNKKLIVKGKIATPPAHIPGTLGLHAVCPILETGIIRILGYYKF
jgi:hypothetical protein